MLAGERRQAAHKVFDVGDEGGVRQYQGQQRPPRGRPHGGKIAQVDGECLVANVGRARERALEVHPFDNRVSRDDQPLIPDRLEHRRIIAVGTTTVRTLESAWDGSQVQPGEGDTRIFITPGTPVHVPDLLITNLHLPGSTLLLLVAAFAGVDRIQAAYQAALVENYRFYSLGDAMLLENTRE